MANVLTSVSVGYGNCWGGYTLTDKDWGSRAQKVADKIRTWGTDMFGIVEMHEDPAPGIPNGPHMQVLGMMQTADPDWALAVGDSGNHLYYRPSKYDFVSSQVFTMPGKRDTSDFVMRSKTTSVDFHVVVTHFIADNNDGTSNTEYRKQQAEWLVNHMAGITRGFFVGDFNSSTAAVGYPRDIFTKAGWGGIRERNDVPAINANMNSYDGTAGGKWLEDIMTRADWAMTGGAMLASEVSDHWGWMKATITFSALAPLPANAANIYNASTDSRLVVASAASGGPFTISVYDKLFRRQGWVGDPLAVTVTPRHNAVGTLEFSLPVDHRRLPDLAAEGSRVTVDYGGIQVFSGYVETVRGRRSEGISEATVTANDDLELLWQVLAYPVPGNPVETQSGQQDTRTGTAEAVVKGFVQANVTRLIQPVRVVADRGRGSTATVGMRMIPLADKLIDTANAGGIGLTVRQVNGTLTFDCYIPRVYPRPLTEGGGTVLEWEWSRTGPQATRAVIGGPNAGTSREFKGTNDAARETLYRRTIETFVDGNSETTTPGLIAAGDAAVRDASPKNGLSLQLTETSQFKYGVDGVLVGDVVTVGIGPSTFQEVVKEATITWTRDEGLVAQPLVGEHTDDPDVILGRRLAEIAKSQRTYLTR